MSLVFSPEQTLEGALLRLRGALCERGVPEAEIEARALVCGAGGLTRTELALRPHAGLGAAGARKLTEFAARRLAHEPVSRILGRRGFWTLDLEVAEGVLDPRADTETIVALALRMLRRRRHEPLAILDLGSGSGAIVCALLSELPAARATAVDLSLDACVATRRNLQRCGLAQRAAVVCGCWADSLATRFDLVASNPPYVDSQALETLPPEVARHDPHLALDGGPGGLSAYRAIAAILPHILSSNGVAVLEAGAGQADDVTRLILQHGLRAADRERDVGGHVRALGFAPDVEF
ncbi:MAG TPA: peptide chain release factor N(5)-glutamine methyltransferase [Methylocystis sp.]|nr:peptide chain release factor N(5)-glutamine methyltransferase [Methylocystis sp.]